MADPIRIRYCDSNSAALLPHSTAPYKGVDVGFLPTSIAHDTR
jgi:hypothetical protein